MSKSDPAFLAELEKRSKEHQQTFMQNIADRLGRARITEAPKHPFRGAPDFWQKHELSLEDRIGQFTDSWKKAGGHVERFATMDEAKTFMIKTAEEMKAKRWIRHDRPELDQLGLEAALPDAEMIVWDSEHAEEMKSHAAQADIGVILADHAVSITGTIVTMSASGKGRTVSLLPTVMMALIPASAMKSKLGEVMTDVQNIGFDRMPAGIHFISGPSRSADIENDLTIGVHGPGIVFALIVDEA